MVAENGFAALRERVAGLESRVEGHQHELDQRTSRFERIEGKMEQAHREREVQAQTSRRFVITSTLATSGIVITALSLITALLRGG